MIIFGANPVIEAIRSTPERVRWIHLQKGRGGRRDEIAELARSAGIQIRWADAAQMKRIAPRGAVHNGVIAELAAIELASFDEVIRRDAVRRVVLLDEVTDPGNVGAIVRSADALGGDLVVLPEHRGAALDATLVKASAGAASWVPIAQVTNIAKSIEALKEAGFWVYGTDSEGDPIDTISFAERVAIVLGSEGRGLRPNVRKHCDAIISIPMRGRVDSLNVSVASALVLWELLRRDRSS